MDMNGHGPNNMQMQAMQQQLQQFEAFIQNALSQAQQALGPQFKASAVFVHDKDRERDFIVAPSNLPLANIVGAVQHRMKLEGITTAANDAKPQEGDLHLAVINVVSAIRRAMPFITGPGADTAKRMLLDAIKADAVSETARRVVAGYLSCVPGMQDTETPLIDTMLKDAESGSGEVALIYYGNTELGRRQ